MQREQLLVIKPHDVELVAELLVAELLVAALVPARRRSFRMQTRWPHRVGYNSRQYIGCRHLLLLEADLFERRSPASFGLDEPSQEH